MVPNVIWHLDITQVNLLDGGKAHIQAVVDNFSRFIMARCVSDEKIGLNTKTLLEMALRVAERTNPLVLELVSRF